jgi:hypothetical protein
MLPGYIPGVWLIFQTYKLAHIGAPLHMLSKRLLIREICVQIRCQRLAHFSSSLAEYPGSES